MTTLKLLTLIPTAICCCNLFGVKDKIPPIIEHILNAKILYVSDGAFHLRSNSLLISLSDKEAKAVIRHLIMPNQRYDLRSSDVDEALERLRDLYELQIDSEDMMKKTLYKVNLKNGVYDILSGELEPHSDQYLFTYQLNFNYIENSSPEKAPFFTQFLKSSIDAENKDCFLEMLGYCMSSLKSARKSFFLIGPEKCGKSLVLDWMEYAVGSEYTTAVPFSKIGTEQSRIKYMGSLINLSRETSAKPLSNDDAFKSLISGEKITGRRLYENSKEFVVNTRFVTASNSFPSFKHMDTAILDRIIPIYFRDRVKDTATNFGLKDQLFKETDVVFSAALDKLKTLIENGYEFSLSESSKEILHQKRIELLNATEFLNENFVLDPTGEVSSVLLYSCYRKWCEENSVTPEGKTTFYSNVKEFSKAIRYAKVIFNGKKINGFKGLSFKSNDAEKCNENGSKISSGKDKKEVTGNERKAG